MSNLPKIGFMFGAGAELRYGMPTSKEFSLGIFRRNAMDAAKKLKDKFSGKYLFSSMRVSRNVDNNYIKDWLPNGFTRKTVPLFGKKDYEEIIHSSLEQYREEIIKQLNDFDKLVVYKLFDEESEEIKKIKVAFENINKEDFDKPSLLDSLTFTGVFKKGNNLFKSNYFLALLLSYLRLNQISKSGNLKSDENLDKNKSSLKSIVLGILELQVGALGENLINVLTEDLINIKGNQKEGNQQKNSENPFDFLKQNFSDFINLNYKVSGLSGLEFLLSCNDNDDFFEKSLSSQNENLIVSFGIKVLEQIYSSCIDYKSLIDASWMYLYSPKTSWTKFCKISTFLINVQRYISSQKINDNKSYYDDLLDATTSFDKKFEVSVVGTSNYTPLIKEKLNQLKNITITYLNGSTDEWYDPYLNRIGFVESDIDKQSHILVPLLFTQSGTKPMTSIDMLLRYADYYNSLLETNLICIIGYGFNSDDEHINGIFRKLLDSNGKKIVVVETKDKGDENFVKKEIIKKLKISSELAKDNLKVILVDKENRDPNGNLWIDSVQKLLG